MTSRPRLGELLIASGACTREQLREAWEQKVIYGDRLGTNLLASGLIDEQTLSLALGQQLGVHSGHGKVIRVDPAVLPLVPKALAQKRAVVPHHVADRQLFLLMRDPHDALAIDEVRFATELKVTPIVVCEARMWQLIEHHYRARMSLRPVFLDGPRAPRPRSAEESTGPLPPSPELVSEEEFQRLYASMHVVDDRLRAPGSGEPSAAAPVEPALVPPAVAPAVPPAVAPIVTAPSTAPGPAASSALVDAIEAEVPDTAYVDVEVTNPGRPTALLAQRDPAGEEGFLSPPRTDVGVYAWRETLQHTNPMLAMPRPPDRAAGEAPGSAGQDAEPLALVELVEVAELQPPLVRQSTLDFHVEVEEVIDESPLPFDEATRVLAAAADRTAIARVVLRAARTRFQRACLLTVFRDRLVGWMGLGEGMETERLREVVMNRADRSVFSLVAESRAHYLGPLPPWTAHGAWVKATGRKIPRSLAVFPILVRGRPVTLLVVDNGHDQHTGNDVGEVLILAQQIAKTWEELLAAA